MFSGCVFQHGVKFIFLVLIPLEKCSYQSCERLLNRRVIGNVLNLSYWRKRLREDKLYLENTC